jgi:paraquat-inducible protein B
MRPRHSNPAGTEERAVEPLPRARVKKGWPVSPIWIVPVLAIGFVGWLLYRDYAMSGPRITIRFREGRGIEVGKTQLKYRGVKVGDVTGLKLSKDQQFVEIQVQLTSSASGIARAGSEFWIVQPEVSLTGVRGLRTLVSGDYIQVIPGQGGKATTFTGLEEPPLINTRGNGLKLKLLTANLKSVNPGTPVLYRGIQVGETLGSHLSADAQVVEIGAYVYPAFVSLVRKNSKFWNAGGINVGLGLFGADISAHSFQSVIAGALAFATPEKMEEPAPEGTAFRLYEKAREEWLNWAPVIHLPLGRTNQTTQAK